MSYRVNNESFDSFTKAVTHAQTLRVNVTLADSGRVVWRPAPPAKAAKMRHVMADGRAFSKVRQ